MKRKEAIQMLRLYEVNDVGEGELETWYHGIDKDMREAIDMAIEALQLVEHFDLLKEYKSLLKEYKSLREVVLCEDCRHVNECNKRVRYTLEWCSKGEKDNSNG